jgi:membrane dipeptidase
MKDKIFELTKDEEDRAREIYERSVVIDCSNVPKLDSSYFQRRIEVGITAENVTVPMPSDHFLKAVDALLSHKHWIEKNLDRAIHVLRADDLLRAKKERKAGVIFGPQNANFLEGRLDFLDVTYSLGVRIAQLTYNEQNLIGDGCTERTDAGLSNFGIEVVKKMNKIGAVIDLSHCGVSTFMDAVKFSEDPVLCTHANCKALNSNVRNKSDEQIVALAEKGGVVCLASYSPICETKPQVRPTIIDFLAHVKHVVDLVGVDHVGLGMDFDDTLTKESHEEWASEYPQIAAGIYFGMDSLFAEGLDRLELFPNIARGLVWKGYSDEEVAKILGGNVLRVLKRVWGE